MFTLMLTLSVGVGIIGKEFHHRRDNPVGIVEIEQPLSDEFSVNYFHGSALFSQRTDYDNGVNVIYFKVKIK